MLKKKRGFTLVELMIVIAIISLLMLVLVPAFGLIKNKTREAGMKSNMAMLTGNINSMIDDYPLTATGIDDLEARIAADIAAVTVTNQKMKNPMTKGVGVGTDPAALASTMVVAYATTDDADDGTAVDTTWTNLLANTSGIIAYAAYINTTTNKINVDLVPYGVDGDRMAAIEDTISQ